MVSGLSKVVKYIYIYIYKFFGTYFVLMTAYTLTQAQG